MQETRERAVRTENLRPSSVNIVLLNTNTLAIDNNPYAPQLVRLRLTGDTLHHWTRGRPRVDGNLELRAWKHRRYEARQHRRDGNASWVRVLFLALDIACRAELFEGNMRAVVSSWKEQYVPIEIPHLCDAC